MARLQQRSGETLHIPKTFPDENDFRGHVERSLSHEEQPQLEVGSGAGDTRESTPGPDQTQQGDANLTNPLAAAPSKFMSSSTGRTCTSHAARLTPIF